MTARPDCAECGHPASHHEAEECWTLPDGSQTWDDTDDRCKCWTYEPSDAVEDA